MYCKETGGLIYSKEGLPTTALFKYNKLPWVYLHKKLIIVYSKHLDDFYIQRGLVL